MALRYSLVVPVPEADGPVEEWRQAYDWSALAGVPAHITVLGPFAPPSEFRSSDRDRLRSTFAAARPVPFRLVSVMQAPGLVYLAPEPVAPFQELTDALQAAWPDAPPFGAAFDRPLHHLTLARDERVYEDIRAGLAGRLPIAAVAREVLLLAPQARRVDLIDRFRLGREPN